ncbi:hypothetical protein QOT17_014541 [Balamuthia mandrillaris]
MGFLSFWLDMVMVQLVPLAFCWLSVVDIATKGMFLGIRRWFGVTFELHGDQLPYVPEKGEKVMWLCNHRTWADFFVDHMLTGFQCAYLSRCLVFLGIPLNSWAGFTNDTVWFFRRPAQRDRRKFIETFYRFLDRRYKSTPWHGLLIYPEGSRNVQPDSLPLKKGCINYAYDRGLPVQIIIATNKEHIFNERTLTSKHNVRVRVGYSKVLRPENYSSSEVFFSAIESLWLETWKEVMPRPGEQDKPPSARAPAWEPPNLHKPKAIRRSWVQVRFLLGLLVMYGVPAALLFFLRKVVGTVLS